MKVRFVGANPRERARPFLDDLLTNGVDQIAIACAFLTGGGVELLKRHAPRLQLPNSFVVVAWDWPTNLDAVSDLHALLPGNVYLHLGAKTPVEKQVGPGLMHSKVFFARAGKNCWLWTGSHNLTASASQGVNCEAAVLLEGAQDEEPFQQAMAHLMQCKTEAVLFDPFNPPPSPDAHQTLVIHAECDISVKGPPWFVHLRSPTDDYDAAMRPPASVWLYLYPPNTLRPGRPRPLAQAAYSGTITALNFTEFHKHKGIPADWTAADYVIEYSNRIFHFTDPKPHAGNIPTQGVFRVDAKEDPSIVWLTDSPAPKRERVVGATRLEKVDPDFLEFFTRQSLQGDKLVRRDYREVRTMYRLLRKEIGSLDESDLVPRLSVSNDAFVAVEERDTTEDKFAFIYRAKYRI